jgi:hypothetical protein
MTALLDAALGYAARGIPVYPVHWPRPTPDGASLACSCPRGLACDRPAKHPLVHHGVKDATTDPDRLGRWWCRWPQANVGLATGFVFDALDIDGTIVVALLTVLAAKRAATPAAYPWTLAGLFSAASVAFNIAHAPDRPVAQLVFAMAPIALVLTTHLLMQQVGWRRTTPGSTAPRAEHQAGSQAAHPHRPGDHSAPEPQRPDRAAQPDARSRVQAAYQAQLAVGQTPTGAGLARAAGVSERYGQRLLAEFTTDPTRTGHANGQRPARVASQRHDPTATEGR